MELDKYKVDYSFKISKSGSEENSPGNKKHNKTRPSFTKNALLYTEEFCSNSSIHGLKFLGERKRFVLERLWWLVIITVALYFCTDLILQTYQKWERSPVIVSFAKNQTPIWQIPFPAVTICPVTKIQLDIFNYTEVRYANRSLTQNETDTLAAVYLVCDNTDVNWIDNYLKDEKVLDILAKVAPQFSQIFYNCKWSFDMEKCNRLFRRIITDEGICFTFNMIDRNELYRDEVVQYKNFHATYEYVPWNETNSTETDYTEYVTEGENKRLTDLQRTAATGTKAGITLQLRLFENDLKCDCKDDEQGFRVVIHNPKDVPRVSNQHFSVSLDQSVFAAIKPSMITTSEALIIYSPEKRQCYFDHERQLRFFKVYTQQNCQFECLTNFTLKFCDCVGFFMPRNKSTPICGPGKLTCMKNAEDKLFDYEDPESYNSSQACSCFPACNYVSYDVELSNTDWKWRNAEEYEQNGSKLAGSNFCRVMVFFKEMQFISMERDELYGSIDFWSSCGGLLGLFIGFSFTSLMEILYYLTLRFACNLRKYGCQFWSGAAEVLEKDK